MNTELRLKLTRAGSNKHDKSAKDISITDLVKILTCQKQHQEALFRASKNMLQEHIIAEQGLSKILSP